MIAPIRPAMITLSVTSSCTTMPLAIVAATLMDTSAPTKLRAAADSTANWGDIALVEMLVATALAVS